MQGVSRDSFRIQGLSGAKTLRGSIAVSGAKNSALKLMAASVVFGDEVSFTNIPAIEDIERMAELIEDMGGSVSREADRCAITTAGMVSPRLTPEIAKRLRASVVFTGPLLARFREVEFPHPGGDVIGERPINFFLESFQKMGATVTTEGGVYKVSAGKGLTGADIFFPWISVTATEALMMAAILAKGTTILRNVAMEPEVNDLAEFFAASGAKIRGIGTPTLTIEGTGGTLLTAGGKSHRVIPDRIETGSFVILGALAGAEVTVTNCEPEHVRIHTELLKHAGVAIETGKNSITVRDSGAALSGMTIRTHEYPGFATDLQAPTVVLLTQASGESTVFETIHDGRLNYVQDLNAMGADIKVWNAHQATVKGPTPLTGRTLESPDIRAGLAFLIAALTAKGESTLNNVYHIDRGYEHIETRLQALGANVTRVQG